VVSQISILESQGTYSPTIVIRDGDSIALNLLPLLLGNLTARGYRMGTLDQCLGLPAVNASRYRTGNTHKQS